MRNAADTDVSVHPVAGLIYAYQDVRNSITSLFAKKLQRKECFYLMESHGELSNKRCWEKDKRDNSVIKERDNARKQASDLQIRVAEIQAARYETTLYRLMKKSGDDPGLINALNEFTRILHGRSFHGVDDQPLTPGQVTRLTQFLEEKSKELNTLYL